MVPTMMLPPPSQLVFDYVCVCGRGGGGLKIGFTLSDFPFIRSEIRFGKSSGHSPLSHKSSFS